MATAMEIALRGPSGEPVDLWRTIVSHGVASLPPADLDEDAEVMTVTLPVAGAKPWTVRIRQGRKGKAKVDVLGPPLGARTRSGLRRSVRRVLNLDEDLSPLYEVAKTDVDLAWIAVGAGRMARGATVFEDVVKTICTTNCTWSSTVRMVGALVESLGERSAGGHGRAFPTPQAMADGAGSVLPRRCAGRLPRRVPPRARGLGRRGIPRPRGSRGRPAGRTAGRRARTAAARASRGGALRRRPHHDADRTPLTADPRLVDAPHLARLNGGRKVGDRTIERRFRRYGPYAGLAFWLYLTRDWVKET